MKSIHFFPLLMLLALIVLSSLKLHGSSLGIYKNFLYGPERNDPNLILNKPQGIRSDEWLSTTQITLSQAAANYPEINQNIRSGIDMSLTIDVPHGGFTSIFEPRHFGFHVLDDVEIAFAFKWWFLSFLVLVGSYYFFLEVLPKQRKAAVLFSLGVYLVPMLHWWYQSSILGSVGYAFLILTILLKLHNNASSIPKKVALSLSLSYLLLTFAFLQYPPFQVMVALPAAFYYFGFLLNKHRFKIKSYLKSAVNFAWALIPLVIALAVLAYFYFDKASVIDGLNATVHPGVRQYISGGVDINFLSHIFSGHLSPYLQSSSLSSQYFLNQSEASSFVLFAPMLSLGSIALMINQYRTKKRWPDFVVLALTGFTALIFVWMYIPGVTEPFKLLFFNKIPLPRFMLGLGMAQTLLIPHFIKQFDINGISHRFRMKLGIATGGLTYLVLHFANYYINANNPGYIHDPYTALLAVITVVAIVVSIINRRALLALGLLLLLSAASVFRINPLYKGMDILLRSDLSTAITRVAGSDKEGTWISYEDIIFYNFPRNLGYRSVTGGQSHPQLEYWQAIDPDGVYEDVYNRGAHVTGIFSDSEIPEFGLIVKQHFYIKINPCSQAARTLKIRYILSSSEIDSSCTTLEETVQYPQRTFFIYTVDREIPPVN